MMVGALQPDVQLDKEVYAPGEEIRVTVIATGADSGFVTQESASRDDPSPSATPHAVSDNAMPILRAGSPGKYEVRLYLSENSPNPAAVRAYEVKSP